MNKDHKFELYLDDEIVLHIKRFSYFDRINGLRLLILIHGLHVIVTNDFELPKKRHYKKPLVWLPYRYHQSRPTTKPRGECNMSKE